MDSGQVQGCTEKTAMFLQAYAASAPVTEKVNTNGASSVPTTTVPALPSDSFVPFTVEQKHTAVVHLPSVTSLGEEEESGSVPNGTATTKKMADGWCDSVSGVFHH